ncbi:MAG: hypothetical protein H6658_09020 [Ardenticatenaceae bacterium]|nr:hypothetical protein [Ardenticatenaceae bacterium]
MSATSFTEYVRNIEAALDEVIGTGEAVLRDIKVDHRSAVIGFLAGMLQFENGSQLYFREYVDVTLSEPRLMYAYHYQDVNDELIFRYDNALHRPPLSKPEHKHTSDNVEISDAPTIAQVLHEILKSY